MTRPDLLEASASDVVNIARTVETYAAAYEGIDIEGVEVALLLGRASVRHSSALDRLFDSMNLGRTRGRYGVLRVLYFAEGRRMPQYAIMGQMNVTSASMTGLIDGLANDGLVTRDRDKTDKRVSWVELTEEGVRLCEQLMPAMIDFMAALTSGFTLEEKLQFAGFLKRFHTNATHFLEDGST
jgi:DNA-binding MarR family transcriptional regulator